MSAIGLVPKLTMYAARTALLSSGAKLASCFAYEMVPEDVEALLASQPDIILLSGGTDGGNGSTIAHNAAMLARSAVDVPIIMAGNRCARHCVCEVLENAGKEVLVADNVLPQLDCLNIDPVREIVRDLFIRRIVAAKGIETAMAYVDRILMPTPTAVLQAAKLIAAGDGATPGLGDLMVVDIGGATTDVHSIGKGLPQASSSIFLKGIPEPYDKRTVEGDMGVRYNARTILETVGAPVFAETLGFPEGEVKNWVERVSADTDLLPASERESRIDRELARWACRISVTRHVGHVESFYTPTGVTFAQYGKDLTGVRALIGTGGPLVHLDDPAAVLGAALFDPAEPERLRPREPRFYIDGSYILYAVGLLAADYPGPALRIAGKYLQTI